MKRLPEPALIRGVLVAITGVIAYLFGRQIDPSWIDAALTVYGLLTPVLAGVLIRSAVVPVAKLRAGEGVGGAGMAADS